MELRAGLDVEVTSNRHALDVYGSGDAAGCRGSLFSAQPAGTIDGMRFYEVMICGHGYAIREDHFVPWVERGPPVQNEDLRWRQAAQKAWERIHGRE